MIIMPINAWSDFKSIVIQTKGLDLQFSESTAAYEIYANELMFVWNISLVKGTDDAIDFETNYKSTSNQPTKTEVVTQFELNNKDLKLARVKMLVDAQTPTIATGYVLIPGIFGAPGEGRWIAGGHALLSSFDADDYLKIYVEDKDRILAAAYGTDAKIGRAMTDQEMQAQGDYPEYPIVKSYTDDEVPEENQGWGAWPVSLGGAREPMGEMEVEPIGGYGFVPSGFYLKLVLFRPNATLASWCRVDIFWGKKE